MNTSRRSGFWLACLLMGATVGIVATRWLQAENPPKTIIKSPQDLSSAFRSVSEMAVPAIVAIETKTKAKVVDHGQADGNDDGIDPPENSPFGDDPIFREFLRNYGYQFAVLTSIGTKSSTK